MKVTTNGDGVSIYIHQCPVAANPYVPERQGERVPLFVVLEKAGDVCPHCGFVCPEEES